MSVTSPPYKPQVTGNGVQASSDYYTDDERGFGWVIFAGVLLLMVGTLNFIGGLAAIGNSSFFVHNAHYVIGSLNTWGWIVLCVGVVQGLVGLGVFVKNQFARWTGVVVLGLAAIVSLLFIPAYPFWALSLFTLEILALYGLIAYGSRITQRLIDRRSSLKLDARRPVLSAPPSVKESRRLARAVCSSRGQRRPPRRNEGA